MYCKQIHEFGFLAQFVGRIFFLKERRKKGRRGERGEGKKGQRREEKGRGEKEGMKGEGQEERKSFSAQSQF